MIDHYKIFETPFSLYVFLNWFFCLITFFFLTGLFLSKKYLFIKPSILLLSYTHVFFQWPLAIYSGYYETFLPDPFAFSLLIHAYVIIGSLVAVFIFDHRARIIWKRVTSDQTKDFKVNLLAIFLLAILILGITIYYLRNVPFSQTGLYAIFFRPEVSAIFREKSLKLLDNQFLKYAYSIMVSSVAPILAVMLFFAFLKELKRRKLIIAMFSLIGLLGLSFAISLPGARVSVVNMLVVITIAYLFHRGLPFRPLSFIFLVSGILLLPTLLSIIREGKDINFSKILTYYGYIGHRTFVLTMDVGSWYVHHSQVEGGFGIAAIPKLANLLGVDVINAPNFIGLKYGESGLSTVSAVAGYLFRYYSCFGILSLILSIAGIWLLDLAIIIYSRLSSYLLIPCIAAISLSTLSFISSEYTTVWLTHGFGIILGLSLFLDRAIHFCAYSKLHILS